MTETLDTIIGDGPGTDVPLRLRARHLETPVGAVEHLSSAAAATWPDALDTGSLLRVVLEGAGLVESTNGDAGGWERTRTLADTVDGDMRILLVGLNPSPLSADVGVGFARPGNRYWPAALASGIVSVDRDPLHGLVEHHVGMTDLVKRATARADELAASEYRHGVVRLGRIVEWLGPGIVCVVGLTGWRHAVDKTAVAGPQPELLGGRPVYLMPNPSGLNAHVTVAGLADHFREVGRLADTVDRPPGPLR